MTEVSPAWSGVTLHDTVAAVSFKEVHVTFTTTRSAKGVTDKKVFIQAKYNYCHMFCL